VKDNNIPWLIKCLTDCLTYLKIGFGEHIGYKEKLAYLDHISTHIEDWAQQRDIDDNITYS
jgi:hypothetical protein